MQPYLLEKEFRSLHNILFVVGIDIFQEVA